MVPDVFESSEQFDEWFNLDIEDKDEKNKLISQLHKILRPFMLRRLKADVEKSLPPKHETILFTGMSAVQKKLYRSVLSAIIKVQAFQRRRAALACVMEQASSRLTCRPPCHTAPALLDSFGELQLRAVLVCMMEQASSRLTCRPPCHTGPALRLLHD